ncbi:MAG: acyl carrier protein [Candidatus Saganbacteria bacterium]|nr:acyl carrier protein [Candidatus Saganbacteria bacterium]
MENLDQEIRSIISRVIKLPEDKIEPNTDLFRDLGVDSLLGVEIFATLDKKYKIDLPEKKLEKIRTLNDIISLVKEKTGG